MGSWSESGPLKRTKNDDGGREIRALWSLFGRKIGGGRSLRKDHNHSLEGVGRIPMSGGSTYKKT